MSSRAVLSTLLLVSLSSAPLFAAPIDPKPIGFIAAGAKDSDPNDFFVISNANASRKLYFNVKVSDLSNNRGQLRAWYSQTIVDNNLAVYDSFVPRKSPAVKLNTFILPPGQQVTDFLPNDYLSGSVYTPYRMFFHVPGSGIFSVNRGSKPARIAAETLANPILGPALRLPSFPFNDRDVALQGRLFLSYYNALTGREPYINAGSASANRNLKDVVPGRTGSNTLAAASLGPNNETQTTYFVADDPLTANTPQLWRVTETRSGQALVYGATQFTSNSLSIAFGGPITALSASSSDLFITAKPDTGANTLPQLFHMRGNGQNTAANIEYMPAGAGDPQQITYAVTDPTKGDMCLSVQDANAIRRYARYSYFNNNVTVLPNLGFSDLRNPQSITDAGQYFYFAAATSANDATSYLVKHALSGNQMDFVTVGASFTSYPYNIREICAVSSDGTFNTGTLYFTADVYLDKNSGATPYQQVLCRLSANGVETVAEALYGPDGEPVQFAHNLRRVIVNTSGIFRCYFAAPVAGQGIEPWVTAAD